MARVKIDITANKGAFDTTIKSVKHSLEDIKGMVAGAFTVEAIRGLVEKTFEYADTIDKASLRLKMTTEETQALTVVAREAGSSLETIESAFRKIEIARAKALGGDAKSLAAFKALGVDGVKIKGDKLDIAAQLASAAQHGSSDVQGVALAKLGLKGAAGDLTALGDSLGQLKERTQELLAQGAIISDKDIADMVRAKDEMAVASDTLVAQLAPAISGAIEGLEKYFIIFEAYWSNLFGLIMQMAQDTYNFVKGLGSSVVSSGKNIVSGAIKGSTGGITGIVSGGIAGAFEKNKDGSANPAKVISDFGSTLKTDITAGAGSFAMDVQSGLDDYNKKIAAQMAARARARQDTTNVIPFVAPKTKSRKEYSDSLTSVGNLLGASFSNIKSVTTQTDIARSQLSEARNQTQLLQAIVTNTADKDDDSGDDWTENFN